MIYRGCAQQKVHPLKIPKHRELYKVANFDFNYHMFNDGYLTMAIQ